MVDTVKLTSRQYGRYWEVRENNAVRLGPPFKKLEDGNEVLACLVEDGWDWKIHAIQLCWTCFDKYKRPDRLYPITHVATNCSNCDRSRRLWNY